MKQVIDIERLLHWTYQAQCADAVAARVSHGLGPSNGGRSSLLKAAEVAALGCRVDGGLGPVVSSGDLHPDAEAVHDAVSRLPVLQCGLVVSHAKAGDQPDWLDMLPSYQPLRSGNGKPVIEYADPLTRRNPLYCYVELVPSQEVLDYARFIYAQWHTALVRLAGELDDLADFLVKGPSAPVAPWKRP